MEFAISLRVKQRSIIFSFSWIQKVLRKNIENKTGNRTLWDVGFFFLLLFQNVDGSFFCWLLILFYRNRTDDNRYNGKAIFIRLDDLKVNKKRKLEMAGKKREKANNFKVNLLFLNLYCCCLVDYVYIKTLK